MRRKNWNLESNRPRFESQLCKPPGCPILSLLLNFPTLNFILCEMTIKKKEKMCLFIWLFWVLIAAHELSCPLPCGIEPESPALADGSLTRGPPGKS